MINNKNKNRKNICKKVFGVFIFGIFGEESSASF